MDALNLSKAIRVRKTSRSSLDLIVDDICMLGDGFSSFSVYHVRRCGNIVAHMVARLLPFVGSEQLFVDDFCKVF